MNVFYVQSYKIFNSSWLESAKLARNIHSICSASLFLDDGSRHDPDGQFAYEGAQWPTFVIEVANSKSKKDGRKNLPKLAD